MKTRKTWQRVLTTLVLVCTLLYGATLCMWFFWGDPTSLGPENLTEYLRARVKRGPYITVHKKSRIGVPSDGMPKEGIIFTREVSDQPGLDELANLLAVSGKNAYASAYDNVPWKHRSGVRIYHMLPFRYEIVFPHQSRYQFYIHYIPQGPCSCEVEGPNKCSMFNVNLEFCTLLRRLVDDEGWFP